MSNATHRVEVRAVNAPGPDGRRCRAGRFFGPEPTVVDVTSEEIGALEGDPVLSVREVKPDGSGQADDPQAGKARPRKGHAGTRQ